VAIAMALIITPPVVFYVVRVAWREALQAETE
jgi:hypothetical protein